MSKKHGQYPPIVLKAQDQVAAEFGVAPNTVKAWRARGMPGGNGKYVLRDVIEFFADKIIPARIANSKKEVPAETTPEKAIKEQLLRQKYRTEEIKYAERIRELMPREHVRQAFVRTAELYRTAGELLRRHHGDEAQQILLDAIDGAEKELENMFTSLDDI